MENKTVGPFNNPFQAAATALAEADFDSVEFSTYNMWPMCGQYNFHECSGDFLTDLLAFMDSAYSIKVEHKPDGFYARKLED